MEAMVLNTIGSFAALAGLRVRERERERVVLIRFSEENVPIKRGVGDIFV
jgi:hypothetical protein